MKQFFISHRLVAENNRRFFSEGEPLEDNGSVFLYNKNANNVSEWKIVRRCLDRYGWVVERDNIPDYWKKCILEEID